MSNGITVTVSSPTAVNVTVPQQQSISVTSIGSIGFTKIENIIDLDLSDKKDGSVISYNQSTDKWITTTLLNKQIIEAGEF